MWGTFWICSPFPGIHVGSHSDGKTNLKYWVQIHRTLFLVQTLLKALTISPIYMYNTSILVYQTSPSSPFSGWSLSSFCNNHITLLELDLDPQSIIIQNSVKIHQQNHWYVKGQGHLIVISKFIGNYLPFRYRIKYSCAVVCWIGRRADVGGGTGRAAGETGIKKNENKGRIFVGK